MVIDADSEEEEEEGEIAKRTIETGRKQSLSKCFVQVALEIYELNIYYIATVLTAMTIDIMLHGSNYFSN